MVFCSEFMRFVASEKTTIPVASLQEEISLACTNQARQKLMLAFLSGSISIESISIYQLDVIITHAADCPECRQIVEEGSKAAEASERDHIRKVVRRLVS